MNRRSIVSVSRAGILAAVFLSFAGFAQAGPIDWGPDVYDPANDIYFDNGGAACTSASVGAVCASLAYSHDLTAHGFVPGLSSLDQLTGGLLEIVFRDDEDDRPNEAFKITLENILQPGAHDAATPFSFSGISGMLLWSLQQDGVLSVLLERQNGDFVFEKSTFTAYGRQEAQAVPEPASLLLFGMGAVAAGARVSRRLIRGRA
jgi:hypothetical protein